MITKMKIEGSSLIFLFSLCVFVVHGIKIKRTSEFQISCRDKNVVKQFCSMLKNSIFRKKVGNRCQKKFVSVIKEGKEVCFTSEYKRAK